MFAILRLLLLIALFCLLVYSLYRTAARMLQGRGEGGAGSSAGWEECPACYARIRVGQEPGNCPKCGEKLGRGPDGRLLIRLN